MGVEVSFYANCYFCFTKSIWPTIPSQVENLLRKCMHLINLIGYAYYVSKVLLSLSTSNLISVRVCASYKMRVSKTKQSLVY